MGPGWMPTLSRICWKVSTTSMKSVLREKLIKSFAPPAKSPKDLSGLNTGTHRTKTPYILIEESQWRKPTIMFFLLVRTPIKRRTANISFSSLLVFLLCEWEVVVLPVLIGRWLKSFTRKETLQGWASVLLYISTKKIKNSAWKDYFESRRCLRPVPWDDFCASCRLFLFALRVFKSSAGYKNMHSQSAWNAKGAPGQYQILNSNDSFRFFSCDICLVC